MDGQRDFYTGAMYGVIDAARGERLTKPGHRDHGHWCVDSDSVPGALISTGHERLLGVLLTGAKEIDNTIVAELLQGYFKNGQFDKVVSTLKQYPDMGHGFSLDNFIQKLIDSGAEDQLIIDFAEYVKPKGGERTFSSMSDNSFYFKILVKGLWKANRHGVARTVLDRFFDRKEKPFMLILERISKGEVVTAKEITKLIDNYCPLEAKGKKYDYFEGNHSTDVLKSFLSSLDGFGAPIELLKATLEAHGKRKKTGQMTYMSDSYTVENKVRRGLMAQEDFDGAEKFSREIGFGSYGEEEVLQARIAHSIKTGDIETSKRVLTRSIQLKEKRIKELLKEKDAGWSWHRRIEELTLRAEQDAERAILEIISGTPESAQAHIDAAIASVEKISVPPKEDCPEKHKKTFRKSSRLAKRSIREKFFKLGMLHFLPEKDKWNNPLFVTAEQKEENKKKNRVGKSERRNTAREDENAKWIAKEAEKNKGLDDEVRVILANKDTGEGATVADEAIAFLRKQIFWKAHVDDWNRGIIILEAFPDRFTELVTLLSKNYFDRNSYRHGEEAFDGMAAFYIAGKKLGIVTEEQFDQMFEQWRQNCRGYDGEQYPMTHNGTIGLIKGLMADGDLKCAITYFKKLQKTEKLSRATTVECLTLFIRFAAENLGEESTGASAAFKGTGLPEGATANDEIEYWNSQMEILIAMKDDSSYEIAYAELAKRLDTPESVRVLTKLMALGSIRTPHQKKDILTNAYGQNKASQEARFHIVEAMIDHDITGAEAMPEVKSKETPYPVAVMLFRKLIAKGILHKHTEKYLDETNLPYLRRLLSQYQNQFNTVMEIIAENPLKIEKLDANDMDDFDGIDDGDDDADDEDEPDDVVKTVEVHEEQKLDSRLWEGIFTVLGEVGVLTPGIYAQAKSCDFNKKELMKIAERFAVLKKDIFSNRPIDSDITPELVAELVYVAYQPVNMSFQDVLRLCRNIKDCSGHLAKYKFPEDGYKLDLTGNRTMKLRQGATVSTPKDIYRRPAMITEDSKIDPSKNLHSPYLGFVRGLCKFGRLKLEEVDVSDLLVVLEDDGFMKSALKEYVRANSEDATYRSLRLLQEALGIYLTDNLEAAIREFLRQDKATISNTLKALTDSLKKPGMAKTLSSQLGIEIDESKSDIKLAAQVIAQVALKKFKPLKDLRKMISDDLKKFVTENDEKVSGAGARLRAIISKNKASFFAKASAGICTANDITLFNREDHFHINLIDEDKEKCVGNVQAYIMNNKGHPYLLLRGFNPSTSLLKDIDAGSLTESIIAIGERFAEENGLAGVLLSEQGGFLALSNRPEVRAYIERTYKDNFVEVDKFNITEYATISAAYAVRGFRGKRVSPALRNRMHQEDGGISIAA